MGPSPCPRATGVEPFLLRLASTGRLGAEGSVLRAASIQLQQREARDMEDAVAAELESKGWVCRPRVDKLPGVALTRENGDDLGDVDVLAADLNLKILACFEAKSLAGALAPRQLRNELDETFAPKGKRPSAAIKFTERVAIVRTNVAAALKLLNIDSDPEDWQVGMVMITDPELLSPLLDACPVPVISLEQLRALPASGPR